MNETVEGGLAPDDRFSSLPGCSTDEDVLRLQGLAKDYQRKSRDPRIPPMRAHRNFVLLGRTAKGRAAGGLSLEVRVGVA
jgi:hypothetical protein